MRGLYLITPDEADTARLLARVDAVLAGAALLQYRNKSADATLRRRQVDALLPLCRRHGVPLLVNDDVALAANAGADGAHVGRDDAGIRTARRALGVSAIVGATCHGSLEHAAEAAAAGASYLAFGAFHPSPSKPDASRASPQLLRDARRFGLPLVAIGGITPSDAPALIDAGADMVAVISGVFDAADPVAAAHAYRSCFA